MYEKVTQTLREAYDQKVVERDNKSVAPWKEKERAHFLQMLQNEGRTQLLEIGAGTGQFGLYFQEQGLDVICTDLSPAMVESCRQKGIDARVMDFLNLDFANNSFDAVFALNTLLHVPKADFPMVLASIARVLKQDGLFYLGQYGGNNSEGTHEDDHYEPKRFFSHFLDEDIKEAVSQIYNIVTFETISFEHTVFGQKSYNFQSLILRNRLTEETTQ